MRGTIRQRLTISVVGVTAVMLALLVLTFNVLLRSSIDSDVDQALNARAQTTLEEIDFDSGKLDVDDLSEDDLEDTLVWVFADGVPVTSPEVGADLNRAAASLAEKGQGEEDDDDSETRLLAQPIVHEGELAGTVVTGVSLEAYERTTDRAVVSSIVLAVIMLLLVTITTWVVVGRALRPVSKMTEEAANWSENDLDQRFNEGEPTDELTRLAATFDTMLDRMAYMVRHERNFSAELSHELRTPLSAIAAEAEIALRKERDADEYRESLERIMTRTSELTRVLETLLDVARSEGSATSGESADLGDEIEAATSAAKALADRCGIVIDRDDPGEVLRVQVGPATFQRMVAPILENAVTYARGRVSVSASRTDSRTVDVIVADDGHGFSPQDLDAAFEPGRRGPASRNEQAPAGTGLGLALARRLAHANGGEVTIAESREGGSVVLSVPLARFGSP